MNDATITAIISLGTAIATGIGIKYFDFLIASTKTQSDRKSKEFEDQVIRRQELLKEIEYLRGIIDKKDAEILKLHGVIEDYRNKFFDLSLKYTELQGNYKDAVVDIKKNLTP